MITTYTSILFQTQISPVVSSSSGTTITVRATNPSGSVISFMLLRRLRFCSPELRDLLSKPNRNIGEICGDYEEVTRSSMVVAQGLTSVVIKRLNRAPGTLLVFQ
ncbi:PREDICTED: uncharacterized protein LOC106306441 isoform X2 [Brassica oleracea var. oleracea]|uniref:uncharacterized protein LOC106306441 isoform X2 n=1 Tax=Brassica oleracea var. oleracea TaxID=109376 RepID=UPI0006A73962|nr:PREDICTED: uncharacterized protein LOC106306441 isoform X2 [Brassica oleracea var. oleracea]XP_013598519.1 PREDICTED: uncharacterized protein LOC106306441 isoform X2 [Brassica oleracea var. oleracea]